LAIGLTALLFGLSGEEAERAKKRLNSLVAGGSSASGTSSSSGCGCGGGTPIVGAAPVSPPLVITSPSQPRLATFNNELPNYVGVGPIDILTGLPYSEDTPSVNILTGTTGH